MENKNEKTAWLLVRVGIAFAFLYPAVMAHIDPEAWLSFFPQFVLNMNIPQALLLGGFSVVHAIIAFWILSGKKIFIPSLLAAFFLAGVLAFNWSGMDVLFRDISLLLVCLALAVKNWPRSSSAI